MGLFGGLFNRHNNSADQNGGFLQSVGINGPSSDSFLGKANKTFGNPWEKLTNPVGGIKDQLNSAQALIEHPDLQHMYQSIGTAGIPSPLSTKIGQGGDAMAAKANARNEAAADPYSGMPDQGQFYTNGAQNNQPVSPWSYMRPQ